MIVKDLLRLATMSLLLSASVATASAEAYTYTTQEAALAAAQADVPNWMKYLPDNVFVAHLSIPGTHDTMTGHKWLSGASYLGSTMSTTQSASFSKQLEAGIRALDFRPGIYGDKVYCGHGASLTEVTFDAAMETLTQFIDAHPSEFFFMHLFRGNVYPKGSKPSTGCTADPSDIEKYRNIIEGMLNGDGKYANYIIDYNPMLTVGQMRGKIVILRRDRISMLELEKAGNISNWTTKYEPWNPSTVRNATDRRIKGILHAQDVSSPYKNETDEDLEAEKKYCKALLKDAREQQAPNEVEDKANYVPFWVMNFTSGEAGSAGTSGYQTNAKTMNPLAINDIKDAAAAGVYGPTGIVLSDWVLNDTYSGNELITLIRENNFKYIDRFRLAKPEAFSKDFTSSADVPDYFEGKTYFLQHVGTGLYLQPGNNWGTHATVGEIGVPVVITQNTDDYFIFTGLNNGEGNNYLGSNLYMDSGDDTWNIEPVGDNYVIYKGENGLTVGVEDRTGDLNTVFSNQVVSGTLNSEDPMYQWRAIPYAERVEEGLENATVYNPMSANFAARPLNLWINDPDSWNITLGSYTIKIPIIGTTTYSASVEWFGPNSESLKDGILFLSTPSGLSNTSKNAASWSANATVEGLPKGKYTLVFDAYTSVASGGLTMTVNGQSITVKTGLSGSASANTAYNQFEADKTSYKQTVELNITDGKLEIKIAKNNTNTNRSATAFNNFELTYYGDDVVENHGYYTVYKNRGLTDDHGDNTIGLESNGVYAANSLVLSDEDAHVMPYDVNARALTYTRNVKEELLGENAWHAIYLPFEVEAAEINASRVIEFSGVEEGLETDVLLFEDIDLDSKLEAHHLYLVQLEDAIDLSLFDKLVLGYESVEPVVFATSKAVYAMYGNFDKKTDMYETQAYALSGGEFVRAETTGINLKPFRAYLEVTQLPSALNAAPRRVAIAINRGNETTGIDNIADDVMVEDGPVYNLSGQRVINPTPGLYIRNGQKVVIK